MRTLEMLTAAGQRAPAPILLDAEGTYFGTPAMVISRLRGGPYWDIEDQDDWARQLAVGIAEVHALTPAGHDLSHLVLRHREYFAAKVRGPLPNPEHWPLLRGRIWAALRRSVDGVQWLEPALVHDDFWSGNTVWYRRRLSGIVDWTSAAVGDPRTDVAQCRIDMALMYSIAAADRFQRHYERARGFELRDMPFWDLYHASSALASLPFFLTGYVDFGLRHLTIDVMRRRLRDFVNRARATLEA